MIEDAVEVIAPDNAIGRQRADDARLWDALTADGGEEGMCAWLTDRFGVSWQIVPDALLRMMRSEDREAAWRATQAMLKMKKNDIAALEAAYRGAGGHSGARSL